MKRAGSGGKISDLAAKDTNLKKNSPLICIYKTKHSVEESKSSSLEDAKRFADDGLVVEFHDLAQRTPPPPPQLPAPPLKTPS